MGEMAYRSVVEVVRHGGPVRTAHMPAGEAVAFGVHSEVAEHYGVDADRYPPTSTTLDYVVAAAAGWLTGTFGGALEARGIPAGGTRLRSTAVGEVEEDGKVLVIKRIEVTYHLTIDVDADADKVDRAFRSHPQRCPVYRSIHPQIEVTTVLDVDRAEGAGPTSWAGCNTRAPASVLTGERPPPR